MIVNQAIDTLQRLIISHDPFYKAIRGIDLARGPEEWAYYIVLGSFWAR